ncbi:hypothetical protein TWF106_004851 [Orbilia oligospora]|uniref:Uncharacterized protein n=1 Tax=Orbilia oligospora TaxID=2813651 RepID=A0A6G1MER5_ORBOL|nr:hypothetical protein TWF679_001756 [Orbilia oligospora]KAF3223459.1 hypothetical protein TWF106_004851 [Orbilia oligospora]KAF3225279.1 hypothetical protein TWF191_005329 [Orbilia oligospora]KAF3254518.1 hypothetical protein TWF192_003280 [Orbilia oligospora]
MDPLEIRLREFLFAIFTTVLGSTLLMKAVQFKIWPEDFSEPTREFLLVNAIVATIFGLGNLVFPSLGPRKLAIIFTLFTMSQLWAAPLDIGRSVVNPWG